MSDYATLRRELNGTHPVTGAYSANDAVAASELNAVNLQQVRDTVEGSAIFNVTDDAEYSALTQDEKSRWLAVCAIQIIDVTRGIAKSEARDIFGNQSATWDSLLELKNQDVSRGYQIGWGFADPDTFDGVSNIRDSDVAYARSAKFDHIT